MSPVLQLGWGLALGGGLGLLYDFLRPLRRRHNTPADFVFVSVLLPLWIYYSFGLCGGQIRFANLGALTAGFFLWMLTLSRLTSPLFFFLWGRLFALFRLLFLPLKKIFKKIGLFVKKVFATLKKRGTMDKSRRRSPRRTSGGSGHGKKIKSPFPDQDRFSPRQALREDRAGSAAGPFHHRPFRHSRRHPGR
jgi:hypothetical protein